MPTFDPPLSTSMLSVFEGCKSAYLIAYPSVHFQFCFPFHILEKLVVESQWSQESRITNTCGIHVSIHFCLPELKVRINSSEHFLSHKIKRKIYFGDGDSSLFK